MSNMMSRKVLASSVSLLMMHASLHCGLVFAETENGPPLAVAHSISWQMLPGDSINRLAALFYPRNTYMQQRFVAKTLALNRKRLGTLSPSQVYEETSVIVIPDLKHLSVQANPVKAKPAAVENTDKMLEVGSFAKPPGQTSFLEKIQAEYDHLIQQNLQLKQELARLNQHLEGLQKTLGEMFVLARTILAQQSAAETSPVPVSQNATLSAPAAKTEAPASTMPTAPVPITSAAIDPAPISRTPISPAQAVVKVDAPPAPTVDVVQPKSTVKQIVNMAT